VMSLLPSVCELELSSALLNGFFSVSMSFLVVVFWSEVSSSSVEVFGMIGSLGIC
jgi:hypothetical protein